MSKLTKRMKEALADMPIQHLSAENPLPQSRGKMFWQGVSEDEFQYRTLEALVRSGHAQSNPNGKYGIHEIIPYDKDVHNVRYYIEANQHFAPVKTPKKVEKKFSIDDIPLKWRGGS